MEDGTSPEEYIPASDRGVDALFVFKMKRPAISISPTTTVKRSLLFGYTASMVKQDVTDGDTTLAKMTDILVDEAHARK